MHRAPAVTALFLASCISVPPSGDPPDGTPDASDLGSITDVSVPPDDGSNGGDVPNAVDTGEDVAPLGDATDDARPDATTRHRLPLTVSTGTVSDDLIDFPLLVEVQKPAIAALEPSGSDLGFTDAGGQSLPFELAAFDADAGAVRAWVRVPLIAADDDTTLYMTFEGASTDTPAVWRDYAAVWHFRPDASNPGVFTDRTGNGNAATAQGGYDVATGRVGPSVSLDGSSGWLRIESSPHIQPPQGTFAMWVRVTASSRLTPMSKPLAASGSNSYQLWWDANLQLGSVISSTGGYSGAGAGTLETNEWHHLAMTYDGATKITYLDGVETHRIALTGEIVYDDTPLLLGADDNNGTIVYFFPGEIDETRISPNIFGPAWIAAEFDSQQDPGSFVTVGDLEAY